MYEDIIAFIHDLYGTQETVPLHAPSFHLHFNIVK